MTYTIPTLHVSSPYTPHPPRLLTSTQLFKEAANVAYMVKYMFRESLPLAKAKFGGYLEDKSNFSRIPHAKKQLEVLTNLIHRTFDAYGEVGIFDPEKLATIDLGDFTARKAEGFKVDAKQHPYGSMGQELNKFIKEVL